MPPSVAAKAGFGAAPSLLRMIAGRLDAVWAEAPYCVSALQVLHSLGRANAEVRAKADEWLKQEAARNVCAGGASSMTDGLASKGKAVWHMRGQTGCRRPGQPMMGGIAETCLWPMRVWQGGRCMVKHASPPIGWPVSCRLLALLGLRCSE